MIPRNLDNDRIFSTYFVRCCHMSGNESATPVAPPSSKSLPSRPRLLGLRRGILLLLLVAFFQILVQTPFLLVVPVLPIRHVAVGAAVRLRLGPTQHVPAQPLCLEQAPVQLVRAPTYLLLLLHVQCQQSPDVVRFARRQPQVAIWSCRRRR
ncbi:hypothetical protein HC256_006456 [Beauveria bassiana]|nr:hypothetical protein HC256_006456 [Beauveria bassiana]